MIEGLQPYSDYRDSSAPWFGYVPAHWKVKRLGSVFGERGETNERREVTEILSVLKDRGVILYTEKGRIGNKASDDIGRYKIVRPDDLVVNCMNVIIGSLGRSRYTGCLSPVYYVLRRRDPNHDPRYLELVFQHKPFHESLIRIGNGILAHRMRIPMEKLKAEMFPLPPLDEQAAIVRFLDHANRKIDGFIRAKRKLIGLLNEQKQAIIHRAATRGLDPNVKLKDSGIPWLGDIPEHWEFKKLRHLTRQIVDGTHFTPTYRDEGVAFLRVTDIHTPVIDQSKLRRISKGEHAQLNKRCNPEKGDLLLSKNGTIGVTKVVDWDFPFSIFVSLCLIKPIKSAIDPYFMAFAFEGGLLERQLSEITKTTSVTNLHLEKIRGLIVPVPPLVEQANILRETRIVVTPVQEAIARTEREIALMQEYRTRLTADVVTGKLDVRAAAAKLPEITEEKEVELDATDETEELGEET